MEEDRKYFKNYPQDEEEAPKMPAEEKQEDVLLPGNGMEEPYPEESREEDPVEEKSYLEEPSTEGSFDENSYLEQGGNGYHEAMSGNSVNQPMKKQKIAWKKRIAIAAGAMVAVVMIAFSSIGVYTTFFDNHDEVAPVAATQEKDKVEQTSNTGSALTVAQINEKVAPSVVGISGTSAQGAGAGTGIIMSADGYIMTNAHVVNGFSSLKVTLSDDTEYDATLIGMDTQTDLAVIKIDAKNLTAAEFGDSDSLEVGSSVVAIGNPLGQDFAGSVTNGIVSALDRKVEMEGTTMNYIQTNAAINSGNSGGPLVNDQGLVIGVNSAKINTTVAEGMGFAIPMNEALPIVNELIDKGYISGRPMIGIGGEDIDQQTADYNRVPSGVYVTTIQEKSGAANSGIQVGDIVTAIDGVEVASVAQLNAEKNKHKPGDVVELTVYRMQTGETATVKVKLNEDIPTTLNP